MKSTIITLAIYTYLAITWVINFIQFLNCDFSPVGKEEVIKGLGVFFLATERDNRLVLNLKLWKTN